MAWILKAIPSYQQYGNNLAYKYSTLVTHKLPEATNIRYGWQEIQLVSLEYNCWLGDSLLM